MKSRIVTLLLLSFYLHAAEHTIAILGLGGRAQYLLLECMRQNKHIRVVAICDDHAAASCNWFLYTLQRDAGFMVADAYRRIFERAVIYPDTEEGLKKLFAEHTQLDSIFITSSNDKHYKHLTTALAHSQCKNIYIEKPLFRTLEEFQQFKGEREDVTISVGLTLRYANMTKIIVDTLQTYQQELGTLQKLKSWERLGIGHGLTIIMMNWRRYISRSGGLLLEKSIHDLDLSLFFIRALEGDCKEMVIDTHTAHRLFKKSQKKQLLKTISTDDQIRNAIGGWCGVAFQRAIPFAVNTQGYLDTAGTVENVFKDFPDNDNFNKSDIIPDYHKLMATYNTQSGKEITFELEVDMSSSTRLRNERGLQFEFEHGTVMVDIMGSSMVITFDDKRTIPIDLKTNNSGHAGGDAYIAQLMMGTLADTHYRATFNDDVVQLATFAGLISEQQAVGKRTQHARIKKINNRWAILQ